MSGDTAVPIADVESDVGDWVSALFSAPTGTILVGASEMLTWTQWVHTWAKVNGVEARYEQVPVDEYAARMECMGDAVEQEFQFVEEYGFAGGNPRAVDPEGVSRPFIACGKSHVLILVKDAIAGHPNPDFFCRGSHEAHRLV